MSDWPAARVRGPLAGWELPFRSWMAAQGYATRTVSEGVWHLDGLSQWLGPERLMLDELTPEQVARFQAVRSAAGYAKRWSRCALPLRFLREVGAVPSVPTPTSADGPVDRLLAEYRGYLVNERGLAAGTIANYTRSARIFLIDCEHRGLPLSRLTAADVSRFLASECPKRNVPSARDLAIRLRPLLRYLHVTGIINAPLRWAVPPVANWRDRSLPRGLGERTIARMLATCDQRRRSGRRDYAIMLLMLRLGLRAGEVAALGLDDLDWRAGELVVHGKGHREDRLPVPVDVGRALVSYLRLRPKTNSRIVFMRVYAPVGPLGVVGVKSVVPEVCERAAVPIVGAHRLRHTAATQMLRGGGSLSEVAQVLRHSQLRTTVGYAKVDRASLRPLALPWPGGER